MKYIYLFLSIIIGFLFANASYQNIHDLIAPDFNNISIGFIGVVCSVAFNYISFVDHPNAEHSSGGDVVFEGVLCVAVNCIAVLISMCLVLFAVDVFMHYLWIIIMIELVYACFNYFYLKRYSVI